MSELWIAYAVVIALYYFGMGRLSIGAVMWATGCVFIGYMAGALRVIHALGMP